jgi:hypothetical protein
MRSKSKVAPEYGIYRVENVGTDGYPLRLWLFAISRQRQAIKRNFHDGIYGGEASALLMAKSYREAVLHLFPPLTRFQLSSKPRSTNTSGTPGVYAIHRGGKLVRWRAKLEVKGRVWHKSFSIRDYGEEQAKALAIAERTRMPYSPACRCASGCSPCPRGCGTSCNATGQCSIWCCASFCG